MKFTDHNLLILMTILLLIISLTGPYITYQKGKELEDYYNRYGQYKPLPEITGKASSVGTLNLRILLPPPSMNTLNLTATLESDNESVRLSWHNVSNDNFSIYITDDINAGFDYGAPNLSGLTDTTWVDTNASDVRQRYYKIGIWNTGVEYASNETVGKYEIPIYYADGNPAGYELNQISLPLIPGNLSFNNIARWGTDGDIVLRFNTTNLGGTFVGWETKMKIGGQWFGGAGEFEYFNPLEGFVFVNVQTPYNLTIVGTVSQEVASISMPAVSGTPATYEMSLLGWNSIYKNCNLTLALNTTTPPEIMVWFNTTNTGSNYEGWQTDMIFGGTWFPADGCMLPGYGYRFLQIGTPYTWQYNRSG
jgi:hypothetical protein